MPRKHRHELHIQHTNTQEVQLLCNCCGQPYYPSKSWLDRIEALVFGTDKYSICPLCTQAVPDHVFKDAKYRMRCHYEVARLQRMFEQSQASKTTQKRIPELKFKV